MLVDSNILIYAAQPAHAHLRRFVADHAPAVSAVSYVEVLGYHQLDDQATRARSAVLSRKQISLWCRLRYDFTALAQAYTLRSSGRAAKAAAR